MKILVVDDDLDRRDAIGHVLRRAGYRVVTAADGQEALARHRAERPDLVLLDLGLPGLGGLEVCRRIRATGATPVVVLSARADAASVEQGLLAGADDYLPRPFGDRQLLARVRALLDRALLARARAARSPGPEAALAVGELRVDAGAHEVTVGGAPVRLSPTEFRLLHVLAANAGRVVPAGRLVEHAWDGAGGAPSLLRGRVASLRRKLGLGRGGAAAAGPGAVRIRSVPGLGYVLSRAPGGPA
jgi:DNA-binding response OmpR family regulator